MTLIRVESVTGDNPSTASIDVQRLKTSQEINKDQQDINEISLGLNTFSPNLNLIGQKGGVFRS
jgi:hypothetical protein